MANIREVAKQAGVSITTVSRVMSDDGSCSITDDTRLKVLNAIKSLNYKPKQRSKCIKQEETTPIRVGCIINCNPKFTDNFYMSILSSFEKELTNHRGELVFIKTVNEINSNRASFKKLLNSINHMLVMECLNDELLQEIQSNVEYVVGIDIEDFRIDRVCFDKFRAALISTQYLIQCGHQRIAFIGGDELGFLNDNFLKEISINPSIPIADLRFMGYFHAITTNNIPYSSKLAKNCEWNREKCEIQVKELLNMPEPPTAIVVASDYMAISAISSCGKLGFNVPRDISIIGISDIAEAQFSNPPLTTVHVPTKEMGITAAIMISSKIAITNSPKTVNLPLNLVVRDSVKNLVMF